MLCINHRAPDSEPHNQPRANWALNKLTTSAHIGTSHALPTLRQVTSPVHTALLSHRREQGPGSMAAWQICDSSKIKRSAHPCLENHLNWQVAWVIEIDGGLVMIHVEGGMSQKKTIKKKETKHILPVMSFHRVTFSVTHKAN